MCAHYRIRISSGDQNGVPLQVLHYYSCTSTTTAANSAAKDRERPGSMMMADADEGKALGSYGVKVQQGHSDDERHSPWDGSVVV